ncbi:MAG: Gmad2 immunoglobulin-like domain-containing protein [Actinomycetota bacterium]|nr:Gmad2 immunoglobulin-like domain-containing protein [Actinomycetota bacterium]
MNTHDDTDRELREAVRSYGRSVQPSDRLGEIRARTRGASAAGAGSAAGSRTGWWRGPWLLAGGAGVLAASVIAISVIAIGPGPSGSETPAAGPSGDGQTSAEPSPSASAQPGVQPPMLIDSPAGGATVSSPVSVSGTSDTFEANVTWEVLQGDRVVQDGSTMGGTLGKRRPFTFDVQLAPGEYTIRAYALSQEDGSLAAEDTKAITVE